MFASLIALTPDLDVLFHVYRSLSHSAAILAIIVLPILAIAHKNKLIRNLALLAAVGVITHLVLDLFDAYTPLLWPISNQSIQIFASLNFHMGSSSYFTYDLRLLTRPYEFGTFQSMDAPVITTHVFAISLVLLAPWLIALIRNRAAIANRK
jgi:membrane-bound metal-dependent hydrolase YbcI (DUF457 family)